MAAPPLAAPPRAEAILAHLPAHVTVLDLEGRILYLNRGATGYSPDEVRGADLGSFFHPAARFKVEAAFKLAIATRKTQDCESSIKDVLGRERRYRMSFSPMAERGRVSRVIALTVDLTAKGRRAPPRASAQDRARALTSRQTAVLTMVAKGFANRDIARELRISVRTVEAHRREIGARLELRGAAALTRFALSAGLVGA